jgi:2,3-bisphosphoglycerate-independent phosphoglycerate mutase
MRYYIIEMFGNLFKKQNQTGNNTTLVKRDGPVVLVILDGLGVHPDPLGNAVLQSKTPFLDAAWTNSKNTLLHASGVHVGLPELEPGNSEVGHLNIGSGQVVYQSLPMISDSIRSGKFQENPKLLEAFRVAKERKTKLHLMGILSTGGVHGHTEHLYALLDMCKEQGVSPYIHCFTDGRDTGLTQGVNFMTDLKNKLSALNLGRIASVGGRFYGMDRDKRWERTQIAYDSMVGTSPNKAVEPLQAIQSAYDRDENDQIMTPTTIVDNDGNPIGPIEDNDVVIFWNFREDRARQITKAFVLEDFAYIKREEPVRNLHFVTMTGYEDGLPAHVVFPPKRIEESLARVISNNGLKQLHISETEKYMHITYFLNGGFEEPHEGEDFFNIPSPKVFDYSQTPAMSSEIIQDEVMYRLDRHEKFNYSFIVINFANPDMLGHTGNLAAAVEAIEVVDRTSQAIITKTIDLGGAAVVIADHGNCETMIDRDTGSINTYHTNNPVPMMIMTEKEHCYLQEGQKPTKLGTGHDVPVTGMLADVAPTVLALMGLEPHPTMTGLNLLEVL